MVMIFGIFTNYRVHSIHIAQRTMAQQHCPKLSKITDHDFLLPLADFFFHVTVFRVHQKSNSPAANGRPFCSNNHQQK